MSQQGMPPQFVQAIPSYAVMPIPERNGLGVFGFLVAAVGLLIPTGLVSLLGLMLSLVALGRGPRGFAAAGVILGLLGTAAWLVLGLVLVAVGIVTAVVVVMVGAVGFMLTQPEVVEVTSDMVNVAMAVKSYEQEEDRLPDRLDDLGLGTATVTDPWGGGYRVVMIDDDPGIDVVSAGRDGVFDTDDDIHFNRLDRVWEQAFEDFEDKMDEFGRRLEAMEDWEHKHVRFQACR